MPHATNEEMLDAGPPRPYSGLRGRELVAWALGAGPESVRDLGSMQVKYFQAVSRRAGVDWPEGFFASSVEDLMYHPD